MGVVETRRWHQRGPLGPGAPACTLRTAQSPPSGAPASVAERHWVPPAITVHDSTPHSAAARPAWAALAWRSGSGLPWGRLGS